MPHLVRPLVSSLAGLAALALVLAPGDFFAATSAALADPNTFVAKFLGDPPGPQQWTPTDWDVTILSDTRDTIYPMDAGHGDDCAPPPATHRISRVDQTVFICKNHLMTAIAGGYGVVYLTPNQMIDFSQGAAVLKWDMSTVRTSARDWVDVVIQPYAETLQLDYEDVHNPQDAIHLEMLGGCDCFQPTVVRNYKDEQVRADLFTNYDSFLSPSAVRRDTFELDISRSHLKFGMPAYNVWWVDSEIAPLNWTQGVIQLNHRSYNAEKACDFNGSCKPNTWHWSNVSISPALPFTILRADRRYADSSAPGPLTFPSPAPADAHLRFAAVGKPIEVSVDGGQTWQRAPIMGKPINKEEHDEAYWVPVPAGTTSVLIRGQRWFGGDWLAHDISIWAPPSGASSTTEETSAPQDSSPVPAPAVTVQQSVNSPSAPPASSDQQKITFDDTQSHPTDAGLSGQLPTGVIDWGSGKWWLAAPWQALPNNSISFNEGTQSANFSFVTPRALIALDAYNGGEEAATVTLKCTDQTDVVVRLNAGETRTITTGWNAPCSSVNVSTTNGWFTNFSNLVVSG